MPEIHEAIRAKDAQRVKALLAADPSIVSAQDDLGWTPLHLVAAQGCETQTIHEEVARLLLAAGADVHAECRGYLTPLHLLAANGSVESVGVTKVLLEAGANPIRKGNCILMPLQMWQHGKEVKELLMQYAASFGPR